jgi:hypothetical protein
VADTLGEALEDGLEEAFFDGEGDADALAELDGSGDAEGDGFATSRVPSISQSGRLVTSV